MRAPCRDQSGRSRGLTPSSRLEPLQLSTTNPPVDGGVCLHAPEATAKAARPEPSPAPRTSATTAASPTHAVLEPHPRPFPPRARARVNTNPFQLDSPWRSREGLHGFPADPAPRPLTRISPCACAGALCIEPWTRLTPPEHGKTIQPLTPAVVPTNAGTPFAALNQPPQSLRHCMHCNTWTLRERTLTVKPHAPGGCGPLANPLRHQGDRLSAGRTAPFGPEPGPNPAHVHANKSPRTVAVPVAARSGGHTGLDGREHDYRTRSPASAPGRYLLRSRYRSAHRESPRAFQLLRVRTFFTSCPNRRDGSPRGGFEGGLPGAHRAARFTRLC